MIGKKFTNLANGRVVEVKDMFEDIIILDDNSKVRTSRLTDKSFYEEYIDPSNFFQNQSLLNSFAQKIKQIPNEVLSKMADEDRNIINESLQDNSFTPRYTESAVLPADPELEKEELMKKYNIKGPLVQNNAQLEAKRQIERFESILQEPEIEEGEIIRIEVGKNTQPVESITLDHREEKTPKDVEVDPIVSMFKNVKRNKDFKITIEIDNKIPRADFIEMMEDSYNTSIIDFLANEFTNNILQNPNLIKDKIIEGINKIVYGEKITKEADDLENKNKKATNPKSNSRTTRTKKIEVAND